MAEYITDVDLEQPLLDEGEDSHDEQQQQQQHDENFDDEHDGDNNTAEGDREVTPLCSMAALSSVGLGFITQMVVFLALDSSMGHPPSIVMTLPISVLISIAVLFVMSIIPTKHFIGIMTSKTFLSGLTLGTCIQMVSLGSTAIMALKFGNNNNNKNDDKYQHDVPEHDPIMYYTLVVLSQSWWILFPIICLAIEGGLTGNGRSWFGRVFFGSRKEATAAKNLDEDNEVEDVPSSVEASRREIFLGGVRFHVGIVVGCFLVWSLIDVYFKASTGILLTLAVSFVACMALCYGMVYIHDRYIVSNTADDIASKNTQVKKPVYVDGILVV